jgi:hypothetical protein
MESQVDILYHYPPELLELLCDTVPLLFRSKQGIIDFFAGAGVPGSCWPIGSKNLCRTERA